MKKYFCIVAFILIIGSMLCLTAYLGFRSYVQINSSDAIKYLVDKYEIEKKDVTSVDYLKYSHSPQCKKSSSKCSDDMSLLYSFVLKTKDNHKIIVKQYRNKIFKDNYKNGTIRDSYLKKMELIDNDSIVKIEDKIESN